MTRARKRTHTPAEKLASLLLDATLAAYVRTNSLHSAPEWQLASHILRSGFRLVAEELLRRGVHPPLEDVVLPVQWLSEKEEDPAP